MKAKIKIFFLLVLLLSNIIYSQINIELGNKGEVKYWYVLGPFEQPTFGFGNLGDKEIFDENNDVNLIKNENLEWKVKRIDEKKYLDLNEIFGRSFADSLNKIWFVKSAYAFAIINSKEDCSSVINFGGNTLTKIYLNSENIYEEYNEVNAADKKKININLREGDNYLLLKIANTHKNFGFSFFEPLEFQWGFYFNIVCEDSNLLTEKIINNSHKFDFNITPTFFIKNIDGKNQQKFYLDLFSNDIKTSEVKILFEQQNQLIENSYNNIVYGHNSIELYLPEKSEPYKLKITVELNGEKSSKTILVEPPRHYELHLAQLSHTDIGYTATQPIVKSRHVRTLDGVLEMCESDNNFKWTIETLWMLEEYRKSKKEEDFLKIISLIKEGRIYLSPIYTNPFTGLISENEAYQSLELAKKYKKEYGINFNSAIYNDVPGQSMFLPKLLSSHNINFLANGINEIFNDYSFQRNLPKAFIWLGTDSSKVINYFNESYVEGLFYGLERNNYTIESRIWERINKLKFRDYDYELILLNGAFTDNAGIAVTQYKNALKWNEEFVYPKFIISTLSEFAEKFTKNYKDELPIISGDFTSSWDIFNQGEFERNIRLRETQRKIKDSEILSLFAWLQDEDYKLEDKLISESYDNSLLYTGHGSGLEYGYGTKIENIVADDYREMYSLNAEMNAEEVFERVKYQLTKDMESFDNFGVVVFNTTSIPKSETFNISFSALENNNYEVVDLTNNKTINSFHKDDEVAFFAENIPAYGIKKFAFKSKLNQNKKISDKTITRFENDFYKVRIDTSTKKILQIFDKELNQSLLTTNGTGLLTLTQKNFDDSYQKSNEVQNSGKIRIIKNEDFSHTVFIENKYKLLPLIELTFYNQTKDIHIETKFDFTKLEDVKKTQNYFLEFPFITNESDNYFDLLGGEFNSKNKNEWLKNKAFSIRDYIRIKNNDADIFLASPDCRIFEIIKKDNDPILVANIANNFQNDWNRNEKNDKPLTFRFVLTSKKNSDKYNSKLFGKSLTQQTLYRKTWFNNNLNKDTYFKLDNPLVTIESVISKNDDEIIVRLKNNSDKNQRVKYTSKFFSNKIFSELNNWYEEKNKIKIKNNNVIEITLLPNQLKYITIKRNNNPNKKGDDYEKDN